MKFKVIHSVLSSPTRTFKQDDHVSVPDLTDAGFDLEFLKKHGAIEVLEGTEDAPPKAEAPPAPIGDDKGKSDKGKSDKK